VAKYSSFSLRTRALLDYAEGSANKEKPHSPSLLVLENHHVGKLIIRGNWQAVGTFSKARALSEQGCLERTGNEYYQDSRALTNWRKHRSHKWEACVS
jgi:hypothetical protein